MGSNPTVPTILENSADSIGAFLVIVNYPAPKLHQKSSKLDKKKPENDMDILGSELKLWKLSVTWILHRKGNELIPIFVFYDVHRRTDCAFSEDEVRAAENEVSKRHDQRI
jgi:hypothetical protein